MATPMIVKQFQLLTPVQILFYIILTKPLMLLMGVLYQVGGTLRL